MRIDLQVHPFFENYGLTTIWYAMHHNSLDTTSLLYYNQDAFPDVWKAAKSLPPNFKIEGDNLLIQIRKGPVQKCFLRGLELMLRKDNLHLLVYGYPGIPPGESAEEVIENSLAQDALVVVDHPFVQWDNPILEITPAQEKKLEELCRRFSGRLALEKNGYCNPTTRILLGGIDVNEQVAVFSSDLYSQGSNNPVISTTDLHARNPRLLKAIGTASIEADLDTSSGSNFVRSLKSRVFGRAYKNKHNYPSFIHFAEAFGIPILLGLYKSRG